MADIARRSPGAAPPVGTVIALLLFPVPVVCFLGAVLTDLAYLSSAFLMWLHFSQWLIASGLAVGALAAVALAIDVLARRHGRLGWTCWLLLSAALLVELLNAFVHTADGWTAVSPLGIVLSILGAVLALASAGARLHLPLAVTDAREIRS